MAGKDLLTRLADAGEAAVGRLGETPGLDRMVDFVNSTRERLDDLTKRVRGMEGLERRVAALEARVDAIAPAPALPPAEPPAAEPATETGGGATATDAAAAAEAGPSVAADADPTP